MERAVAYYRVSTSKQGTSGLGLEAQRVAVEGLCAARGWEIIAPPFTEVESGKRDDRPELAKAINHAQITGAKLVIAKLDRLSRNAAFLNTLFDTGITVVFADMPHADRLMIGIMAQLAQWEGEQISKRTREALAEAKARGKQLGNPKGVAALQRAGKGNAAAIATTVRNADAHAARLGPTIARLRTEGVTSLGHIAAALNRDGICTPRGGQWHASSVRNLLARLGS